MNEKGHQMMNRGYGVWQGGGGMGGGGMSGAGGFVPPVRPNWKSKKADKRRKANEAAVSAQQQGLNAYKPPTLHELQSQNRLKARRFYPKRRVNRFAPFAPRNTTSFIIRAKKSGGIPSQPSPYPVTPAILPTPVLSPSREGLIDMVKEEWGVDGYGSMNGLIRLRSPINGENQDDTGMSSDSESDVEEHVEVERRLDHDLSRFEMIYPSVPGGDESRYEHELERRVDDQDAHIAHLEEENLTLKERLFLMEQEIIELRRRLRNLETDRGEVNDEVNEVEGGGDVCSEKSVGDGEQGAEVEASSVEVVVEASRPDNEGRTSMVEMEAEMLHAEAEAQAPVPETEMDASCAFALQGILYTDGEQD